MEFPQKALRFFLALQFSAAHQQAFLEDVATLIENGIALNRAIELLQEVSNGVTLRVVHALSGALARGDTFATGLEGWFPTTIVEIIRAGEESGTFGQSLRNAAIALARKETLFSTVLNALTYPILVLAMGLGVAVYVNHSIFSEFRHILPFSEWPTYAQNLVTLATFVGTWWWLLLVGFGVVLCVIAVGFPFYTGHGRPWLDRLPVLTFYREFIAARLLETLGLMLANGLVLKRALSILKMKANPYLSWHLMQMEYRLGGGRGSVGEVLDTGLFNHSDIARLHLLSHTRHAENALVKFGQFELKRLEKRVERTAKMWGAIFLVSAAAMAALMIFSIYGVGMIIGTY